MRLLSPVEQSYLSGTRQFTKSQQRYIRYRLKKKLRLLDESRDAAAAQLLHLNNLGAGQPTTTCPFGHGISRDINIISEGESEAHTETEFKDSGSVSTERGSPSLVGRGIANPMSERTRGFEMSEDSPS